MDISEPVTRKAPIETARSAMSGVTPTTIGGPAGPHGAPEPLAHPKGGKSAHA